MTYQDQRNEEPPEAVRSEPVPVQRTSPEDEQTQDEPEQGHHDNAPDAGYHDSAPEAGHHDNVAEPADVRDEDDVYQEAEQERTGYDDPVTDTDVDQDRDRAEEEHATVPDPALAPAAFGATTMGGAAAAAAMAGNRTDTRTDAQAVDERAEADRAATADDEDGASDDDEFVDDESRDRFGDVADRVASDPQGQIELMPGEVADEPVTTLVAAEAAAGFRDRWREVQLRFVDDPRGATAEAQALAEEAADALVDALAAIRTDLAGWQATEGGDTEHLRVAVRRYRDFIDRVLQS